VDRGTALVDRGVGATERAQAAADRGSSARDRENASLDGLTGVYQRGPGVAELERVIDRARRAGQSLVLGFLDIDQLKAVNDSRGHVAGDRMLVQFVEALRSKLRSVDLVIRFGGDEFLCALPEMTERDVIPRFAEVQAALAAASEHGSVTVGIAELATGETSEQLIARADAALYHARSNSADC
jgi:diguanylate cyclase (GGDEF)-like protein